MRLGVSKLGSSVYGVLLTKLVYAEVWVRAIVPAISFVLREGSPFLKLSGKHFQRRK